MSDSDIMINTTFSTDAVQRRTSANEPKRNERNYRKKQYLERKGNLGGKRRNKHKMGQSMQTLPCQTGASAQPQTLPTFTNNRASHPSCSAGSSRPSTSPPTSTNTQNSYSTHHLLSKVNPSSYLAFDCEMVGTGPKGRINQLARCSLVSYEGDVVYDKFIKPNAPVTDYRTRWSGVRPRDLVNAMPYTQARKEILKLLMGKVVIGHAIHNDFKALSYTHPAVLTRDTARIPLLNTKAGFAEHECVSLKRLTKALFNRDIQTGRKGHSSVEDAQATMELYKLVEVEWERELASKSQAS